jgi:hypothetical protein
MPTIAEKILDGEAGEIVEREVDYIMVNDITGVPAFEVLDELAYDIKKEKRDMPSSNDRIGICCAWQIDNRCRLAYMLLWCLRRIFHRSGLNGGGSGNGYRAIMVQGSGDAEVCNYR